MSRDDVGEITERLAQRSEAVCRTYLPKGRREGRYWLVGDVHGAPGRSLFIRLTGPVSGKHRAGKWTDAATGEHGDLLDLIQTSCGLSDFSSVLDEARRFLALPDHPASRPNDSPTRIKSTDNRNIARRIYAKAGSNEGTLGDIYLRSRGLTKIQSTDPLRFQARCAYGGSVTEGRKSWPALIAGVTNLKGEIMGIHRTYVSRDGQDKAPLEAPRKGLGDLNGHGVRFGTVTEVVVVGEGLETVLSVREAGLALPLVAALSSAYLAAINLQASVTRLYILKDNDAAGEMASTALLARARDMGVQASILVPQLGDFNDDLRQLGPDSLRSNLRDQLMIEDRVRFVTSET